MHTPILQDVNSSLQKVLTLVPSQYPGGIAIWGALAPIFDTSDCPQETGVHVHARMQIGGEKCIDETYDEVIVSIEGTGDTSDSFAINGEDAANYNVSAILKKQIVYLRCPQCQAVHSDRDDYAVNPHVNHTCERCGELFTSEVPIISNPVVLMKEFCGDTLQDRQVIDPVNRKIRAKQATFPGGIQIWGSNPAILWTSPKFEEGGIHFHGFLHRGIMPTVDETYGKVSIDGMDLDPEMVRHLMAQQGLPHLLPYLCALDCPECGTRHFDQFDMATRPHRQHVCENCNSTFASRESMPVSVSNPIIGIVEELYKRYDDISSMIQQSL